MGFFDLNIPYTESNKHITDKQSRKATRLKLLLKAMELGYTGIAYNHTIRGVMSEHDRCSISLLPLSSILNLSNSFSATVSLHRRLLNLPQTTPFRQYTRLTVVVDSPAQAAALNSGNPILKSYDIVAVRPLNQSVFEHACLTSEVDLIAIEFGERLPFRLKQSMVKAAIQRGVCFEITYSGLIMDAQVRRQVISNAKLLIDWTRGKNLIFTSAAPSVTEIRGPNDVVNLSLLLGISTERAKSAISKTCRSLLANALRKKQFYKEAIRVEVISSHEKLDLEGSGFADWLNWDPISSGEGDLQLDDLAKSFAAASKTSKTVKAISFASVMDGLPPHGFHIKDLITGTKEASDPPDIAKTMPAMAESKIPVAIYKVPKEADERNLTEEDQTLLIATPEKHHTSICEDSVSASPLETLNVLASTQDVGVLRDDTAKDQTSLVYTPDKHHISIFEDSKSSFPSEAVNVLSSGEDAWEDTAVIEEETKASPEAEVPDLQRKGYEIISGTHRMLGDEIAAVDMEMDSSCNAISAPEISSPLEDTHSSTLQREEFMNKKLDLSLIAPAAAVHGTLCLINIKNKDDLSLAASDAPLHQRFLEEQHFAEAACNFIAPHGGLQDIQLNLELPSPQHHVMQSECASMARVHEPSKDVVMDDQIQLDHAVINSSSLPEISSERIRRKRTPHTAHVFPFKRLLNPKPFKKKARRN